mmetsp:Transcript_31831/g.71886  ORF Transcript_31831/g.71886 Transcript_31831/m.71886 type:complete len:224 (-) Transcript_31831:552-1223(-)
MSSFTVICRKTGPLTVVTTPWSVPALPSSSNAAHAARACLTFQRTCAEPEYAMISRSMSPSSSLCVVASNLTGVQLGAEGSPVSSPSCSTRDSLPLSSGRTLSCRILGFSALFPWRPKGCSWRTLCGPHAVSTTGLGAAQVGRGYAESWQRCTFSQLSRAGEVKKTNSGVVQTIMLPSADTSMLVTGPGHPSSTHEAFSLFMMASYKDTAPSSRPRARYPALV